MSKIIRGAGGGGSRQPPSPTRAPDTLNSRAFVTLQDLISEGEIEGFATASKEGRTKGTSTYNTAALKDVFLDDTSVLQANADSTNPSNSDFNYQDVSFTPRFGTANQEHISGIEQSSSPISGFPRACTVANGGVTQQITNTEIDAVRVTINFPQLQKATDNGDLLGSEVQLKIQVQYNSGGFSDIISDTITGRTGDSYSKDYRVTLTGSFPVDIKVVRITADSTDASLQDSFNVLSMQELIDDKQTYADSAYVSLTLDSKIVSNIPNRKYRIRGVKIRIPGAGASSSGTPTVDNNTGRIIYPTGYIFNGTMGAAQWCSCPSMVLLDLLTTQRYGLGDHITDSNLDLFSFVNASKFANELVDDGFGGQEARFSCNVNIVNSSEAFTVIEELCSVMRCMPIWSAGSISLAIDKSTDASFVYSLSNVTEEGFVYSGSSLKTRHSVIAVQYFNMDSREIDYEVVEDTAAKTKLGVVKKTVKAFGTTSRSQAQRLGKAILFSEQNESEIVTFTSSVDSGITVRPGAVISINDPMRSGVKRSGRINSATTTTITVDSTQDLPLFTGTDQTMSIVMPDNSVEEKTITNIVNNVVTLESALSEAPNTNSIWAISSSTVELQQFRVISVEETEGIQYKITALSYNPNKYENIEQGITLPVRTISVLNAPPLPPTSLSFEEKIVVRNAVAITKLFITWVPVKGVNQYLVQYRFNNGNFVSEVVFRPDIQITNSESGTYEVKIFSYNALLETSSTSLDGIFLAQGKTAPPSDVQNLTAEPLGNNLIRLRWDKSIDADVLHGGRVYVRHSNKTDGSGTFAGSVDLVNALAGNTSEATLPALEGEYILKFQDDSGHFSTNETSVIIDLPDFGQELIVLTKREDLLSQPFCSASGSGSCTSTKTNVTFSSGALKLTNPATNASGSYEFAETLDLGGVFSLTLKRHIQSIGFSIGSNLDDVIDFDQISDFDGNPANEIDCQVFVKTSTDASSFGSFNKFANGEFKARAFKFKADLTSDNTNQNINVQQLGYTATLPSRTEQSTTTIASGTASGGKAITFSAPYFVGTSSLGGANAYLPSIGITAQNMQSGDFFTISNVSGTGFTVKFLNGSTVLDRNFTYQAVGFGKGV
tara:strand:+ start:7191 stop:10535 length:3345 start_codon:yes stop_codon:yes gene_type:complete